MGHDWEVGLNQTGEPVAKNDGPIAATPEERARRLAQRFFPKDDVKALCAATLIAKEIREALEGDRWRRIERAEWACSRCDATYARLDLVHRGLAEFCPRCGEPATQRQG
jgi:hypothetical protein